MSRKNHKVNQKFPLIRILQNSNKGISGIIATVIMIAIVMGVIGVVWISINTLISEKIKSTESCYGNFGKVTLERRYSCYNSTSNEFQFSIKIGDIVVDSVLVSISSPSSSKSFEISDIAINNVKMYNGTYGEVITIPEKNAGFTYVVNTSEFGVGIPDTIAIAPIINDIQCEISDSLVDISGC